MVGMFASILEVKGLNLTNGTFVINNGELIVNHMFSFIVP
jgi:hypothetical protein